MTTTHFGGDRVSGGVYWNHKEKEFISVPNEGGRLGSCENDVYVKTPLWMALLAGPLVGMAFTFLLPLSGLLLMIPLLTSKLCRVATPSILGIASAESAPGLSYLEGRAGGATASPKTEAWQDCAVVQLAEAIAERRMRELGPSENTR